MEIPRILYGTAWKAERTSSLVVQAVLTGFRGIDTACQPKHYREDLVGEAISILQTKHGIQREDLFIQTKFTSIDGQDRKKPLPYNPESSVQDQVKSSVSTSLKQLGVKYIDSVVLHSPLNTPQDTLEAYQALESLHSQGKIRHLGISNIYQPHLLSWLIRQAKVPIRFVQNRWYQGNGFDLKILSVCRQHNIQYQSFWTLSGNPSLLEHPKLLELAKENGLTPEQATYKLVQSLGIVPLSGTTSETHMKQDLEVIATPNWDQEVLLRDIIMDVLEG